MEQDTKPYHRASGYLVSVECHQEWTTTSWKHEGVQQWDYSMGILQAKIWWPKGKLNALGRGCGASSAVQKMTVQLIMWCNCYTEP